MGSPPPMLTPSLLETGKSYYFPVLPFRSLRSSRHRINPGGSPLVSKSPSIVSTHHGQRHIRRTCLRRRPCRYHLGFLNSSATRNTSRRSILAYLATLPAPCRAARLSIFLFYGCHGRHRSSHKTHLSGSPRAHSSLYRTA